MKCATEPIHYYPSHLRHAATLPREIKNSNFLQIFSRYSVNLFAVYPFKYKLIVKILSSSLNIMLIIDKHCSDVCCDEFLVYKLIAKVS